MSHEFKRGCEDTLYRSHQYRDMPRPDGPRTCGRDPHTDAIIAQYEDDAAFSFWYVDQSTGEPTKRAPVMAAFRSGAFSPEQQWKRAKQQRDTQQ